MKKRVIIMRNSVVRRGAFVVAILGSSLLGCRSVRPEYNNRRFDDESVITLKEYVDYLRKAATRQPYEIACGAAGAVEVPINLK